MSRHTSRIVALSFAMLVAFSGTAVAQDGEVLYLSDSHRGVHPGSDGHSHLYRVFIDDAAGIAELELLPNGNIPIAEALGIACTPDGAKIYAFDTVTGKMGFYSVDTAGWTDLGYVMADGSVVPRLVQAAFSPDGRLFAGSETTFSIYEVDPVTAVATEYGKVINTATNQIVPLLGADFAFSSDGDLFMWTNNGSPAGFYKLTLPATPGEVGGTYIGGVPGDFFTGIAFRGNGLGDLVGSSTTDDQIHVHDKSTGVDVPGSPYPMYRDGVRYSSYAFGDLTVGPMLQGFCTRTIGYWKNHTWPISVSVCGQQVDEVAGSPILWDATGRNFSMLTAQLIAAKLNTGNNSAGFEFIDGAEEFLCANVDTNGNMWWATSFDGRVQKGEAGDWKDQLDEFNNSNHCD